MSFPENLTACPGFAFKSGPIRAEARSHRVQSSNTSSGQNLHLNIIAAISAQRNAQVQPAQEKPEAENSIYPLRGLKPSRQKTSLLT
jgi:hypothetical protein